MDIFMSFDDLKPSRIIDNYESLIWTDRYNSYGDFTLTIKEAPYLMGPLRAYKFLTSSESDKIMMIETVEVHSQPDDEQGNLIKVSGRSVEAILEQRTNELDYSDEFEEVGSPGDVAVRIVNRHMVNNTKQPLDNIPNFTVEGGHPASPRVRFKNRRDDLYSVVKSLCDSDDLGFRIRKNSDGKLVFGVYKGLDRTNTESVAYRLFSQDFGNLIDSSLISSIANYKNHARVIGARTTVDVYPPGTSIYVSGFDRRTLVIHADDVGKDGEPIERDRETLRQLGLEALSEQSVRNSKIVDGDVLSTKFDKGIGMGSLVVVRDTYGNENKMRIREIIHSTDADGYRVIPSFSQD